jgi:hypothetical protein
MTKIEVGKIYKFILNIRKFPFFLLNNCNEAVEILIENGGTYPILPYEFFGEEFGEEDNYEVKYIVGCVKDIYIWDGATHTHDVWEHTQRCIVLHNDKNLRIYE